MKRHALLLLISILAFSATAPAFAQRVDNRMFPARLDRLERDIALIQRQLARKGLPVGGGSDAIDDTAGLEVKLNEISEQLRDMRGNIEEAQHANRQLNERLDKMQKDIDFRLSKLEQGQGAMPASLPPAPAPVVATEDGEPAALPTSGETHTLSAAPRGANPRDDYNDAFKLLRQAKHAEAATAFEKFLTDYPGDPLTGNAYYWLGESYYVQRDYTKAADNFRKGFEALPTGPKAADNLYKLALSLSALKENDKACVVLNQLIKKYGASSQNIKKDAEKEIQRLGCGA